MVCPIGEMELSPHVQAELLRIAAGPPLEPSSRTMSFRYGGGWRCPADGAHMAELDGYVKCGECGRCIPGGVLYQLIELHVHAR